MLDIIFIILVLLAIIMMLYSIIDKNITFTIIDATLWFILALFMLQGIEIPYEIYNASSTAITTGVHTIQTNLTPLSYLFMGFGTIMFILMVTFSLETLSDYRKIK